MQVSFFKLYFINESVYLSIVPLRFYEVVGPLHRSETNSEIAVFYHCKPTVRLVTFDGPATFRGNAENCEEDERRPLAARWNEA